MMEEPALAKSEASQRFEVGEEDLSPPEFNDEDLKEYSKRIGIDWETEQHLAHIAVEGLSSRLPTGWKPCFDTERDRWFYFNASCGTSQWEHPLDSHFRRLVQEAREGRVVVGGLKDTSVSTSSQVDTCFDVNEIDEADSVIVDVAESSEEDESGIVRVENLSCGKPSPQEAKTVTERLLAKLSTRGTRTTDNQESKNSLSPVPSSPKGILKKNSFGEASIGPSSLSEQGSHASKSVRFNLDRQTSLDIKFCASEITEEEDGDSTVADEDVEEESASGTKMKPVGGSLGKSALGPISRPSMLMAVNSPVKKPPARLNPLQPLGKIEKKPVAAQEEDVMKPLQPAPLRRKQPVASKEEERPVSKIEIQQKKLDGVAQSSKKTTVIAEDEKLRKLSVIEQELKEAEREKELQKTGETWERKKETLVRRKSFEIEAMEKELEVKKAAELRRLKEDFEAELETKRAEVQDKHNTVLTQLRIQLDEEEKLMAKMQKMKYNNFSRPQRQDIEAKKEEIKSNLAREIADFKKSTGSDLEALKSQLENERKEAVAQAKQQVDLAVASEKAQLEDKISALKLSLDSKIKLQEARLAELESSCDAKEKDLADKAKSRVLEEFRQEYDLLKEDLAKKDKVSAELQEKLCEVTNALKESQDKFSAQSERFQALEEAQKRSEESLKSKHHATGRETELLSLKIANLEESRAGLENDLSSVTQKYERLKSALREARDRKRVRDQAASRRMESEDDFDLSSNLSRSLSWEREADQRDRRTKPRVNAGPGVENRNTRVRHQSVDANERNQHREKDKTGERRDVRAGGNVSAKQLADLLKAELKKMPRDGRTVGLRRLLKKFDPETEAPEDVDQRARSVCASGRRREAWVSPDNGLASSLSSASADIMSTTSSSTTSSSRTSSTSGTSSCPTSPVLARRNWRHNRVMEDWKGSVGTFKHLGDAGRLGGTAGSSDPFVWYEGVKLSQKTGKLVARVDKLSREFALRSPGDDLQALMSSPLPLRHQLMPSVSFGTTGPVTRGTNNSLCRRIAEHQAWLDRVTSVRNIES